MEVLQHTSQIRAARRELKKKGVSFAESRLRSLMRRLRLARGIAVGHTLKSWDVLSTLNLIERDVPQTEPILDIGCYASEVLVALHRMGYSNLTGIDLNPDLEKMPYANSIRYENCNFMNTQFEDGSFRAITSISVIEHGFNGSALSKEMARLLKPGGFFIASFDYWPEKIDTSGLKFFGMDWKIFSKQEVTDFISQAATDGLVPAGEMHYSCQKKPIHFGGMEYTFAWMVLKKTKRE
jgi:SAM-dependent methyltransferase